VELFINAQTKEEAEAMVKEWVERAIDHDRRPAAIVNLDMQGQYDLMVCDKSKVTPEHQRMFEELGIVMHDEQDLDRAAVEHLLGEIQNGEFKDFN